MRSYAVASVVEEALRQNVGVIVAYHPPIFRPLKRLTMADPKQSIVLRCAAAGISVYSPHTALDACVDGINDWLGACFEGSVKPIQPATEPPIGQEQAGMGRIVTLNQPCSLPDAIGKIKRHLNLSHVRVAESSNDKLIQTVAICAGSGASLLMPKRADLYLTGEMGHHEALASVAKGTHVVLCEHSNTEVCSFMQYLLMVQRGYLAAKLMQKLQTLLDKDESADKAQVICSLIDRDPLQIV